MNFVGRPALIAAIIGPIQAVLGWIVAGSLWPGYDHVTKTISDLAADDSPVKWVQSSFFLLGGTLSLIAAVWAHVLSLPGRVTIFIAGLTTYGLTIFATPTQETSSFWHRVFAIATFVLMSAWPLFSMRFDRSYPWIVRPAAAIGATLIFTVGSIAFLSVWTNPDQPMVGLWERVIAEAQVLYLAIVIVVAWRHQQGAARASRGTTGT
jgi:hypothetical membrane protein